MLFGEVKSLRIFFSCLYKGETIIKAVKHDSDYFSYNKVITLFWYPKMYIYYSGSLG